MPHSKHVLTVFAAIALNLLPAASTHPFIAMSPAATSAWMTRLNEWRASVGVSPLSENTTWSQGDYDHGQYMVMNDLVTHYETQGTPYYTTAGDTAARDGNIFVSSTTATTDDQAIDWWMGAPFHAMGLMDPRLTATGFGSYRYVKSGWQMGAAVDVIRGNSFSGGQFPVFFPGNGSQEPLTSYSGSEFPDPLQACPGYASPTGLPLFVMVGGNVATTVGAVHTITGNGVSLPNCAIDSNNATLGSYLKERGGVILIPQQPLQSGVKYTVAMTVNGAPETWSFTVGSFSPCTSAALAPSAPAPIASGTTISFTASSTGCPNPQYAFWVQYPDTSWHLVQGFGGPSFNWNTTGLALGTYTVHVWANGGGYGYDAIGSATVTVVGCASAALTPSSTTAQVGSVVGFTASSAGCASPRYAFWVLYPDNTWHYVQSFGGSAFNWNTNGLNKGAYTVHVWVNTSGNGYDSVGSAAATLTGCASASLSPASGSAPGGTVVAFTAGSTGCTSPRYAFWVLYPDGTWHFAQNFGGPTFNWSTAGLARGAYTIHVWVNTDGNSYDAIGASAYTLT